MAVIISYDYHKGKFETKAQILGMRPEGAAAVLTVAVEILAFIHKRQLTKKISLIQLQEWRFLLLFH